MHFNFRERQLFSQTVVNAQTVDNITPMLYVKISLESVVLTRGGAVVFREDGIQGYLGWLSHHQDHTLQSFLQGCHRLLMVHMLQIGVKHLNTKTILMKLNKPGTA